MGTDKEYSCGLEAALAVVGGKWKVLILWVLGSDPRRFGELRRQIPGISEKMLIQHLKELESDGIVSRKDFRQVPPRVEYALTTFGHSLCEALAPLCAWGQEHMQRIAECQEKHGAKREKVDA
jgi:DNA-binding HxlR family transcriptional regulator